MRHALFLLIAVVGCDDVQIDSQKDYNFALKADRDKWRAQDLAYQGTAGPYAIYKVTGANPELIGPYVRAHHGFSILSGGTRYFTGARAAKNAVLLLMGGQGGEVPLVAADQQPTPPGT